MKLIDKIFPNRLWHMSYRQARVMEWLDRFLYVAFLVGLVVLGFWLFS